MAKNLLRSFENLSLRCRLYNTSTNHSFNKVPINPSVFAPLGNQHCIVPLKAVSQPLNFSAVEQKEYTLPGASKITKDNVAILDPLMNITEYNLPTVHTPITEKVTPPLEEITPKEDPLPSGGVEEKIAGPWMLRIRRKMHKRHALKKRKARNVFLTRKLNRLRHQRKLAKIAAAEREWEKRGEMFSAELLVDMRKKMARMGGYKVDVLAEFNAKRMQKQD